MKTLFRKYRHILFCLYIFFYMPCFFMLEKKVTTDYIVLNSPIDNLIPYIEIFIVPYYIWFFYIAVGCVFLFFKSQREFVKMLIALIIGMTAYLVICYIFPNGLKDFRAPEDTSNIFGRMVAALHAADTSTNVFPSIHVYNSLCVHVALSRYTDYKHKWAKPVSFIICVLICLSTIFIKQHCIIDVIGGTVMAVAVYKLVYTTPFSVWIDKKTWTASYQYQAHEKHEFN